MGLSKKKKHSLLKFLLAMGNYKTKKVRKKLRVCKDPSNSGASMGLSQSLLDCHATASCTELSSPSTQATASEFNCSPRSGGETSRRKRQDLRPPNHPAAGIVRVLLLDGRLLQFCGSIRVLQVLAIFQSHCVCPLDSFNEDLSSWRSPRADPAIETFFRPVCLHPNERLRSDCMYILLPINTLRLFVASAAAASASSHQRPSQERLWFSKVSTATAPSPHKCNYNDSATFAEKLSTQHDYSDVEVRCRYIRRRNGDFASCTSEDYPCHVATTKSSPRMRRCKSWRPKLEAITEFPALS
ncbi:hypothetical protein KP509_08G074400 [Ceratopteris richardii]|uniref:Uncharacterized protein n=1 Tax=Ceratopteris richardii TaxID=49495 RepID=A0A8T2UDI0_CERRI|nr:hypothetical protein KP509_08G074400 [Ceratopteris richardii]